MLAHGMAVLGDLVSATVPADVLYDPANTHLA